jgi:nucleoside-diphosphate-sugar epimerase
MDLDTSKLQALGWRPTVGLEEMYRRMTAVLTD